MILRLFALAALTATQPSADLAKSAKAGCRIGYGEVVDARFDPNHPARFESLRTRTTKTTFEERARYYVPSGVDPDGRPRWRERVRCSNADRKSLTRAMTMAAAEAGDRAAADRIWNEVERSYAYAVKRQTERTKAARVVDGAPARQSPFQNQAAGEWPS